MNDVYLTVADLESILSDSNQRVVSDARVYTDCSTSNLWTRTVGEISSRADAESVIALEERVAEIEETLDNTMNSLRQGIIELFISEIASKFKDFISSINLEVMTDEEFNEELRRLLYD